MTVFLLHICKLGKQVGIIVFIQLNTRVGVAHDELTAIKKRPDRRP